MLIYSAATWAALQAQSTQQARAQTIADLFASGATIEFRDASNALIRSITTAAWTVGVVDGQYVAVPGEFTDAASGSGTPVAAVVKAGSTEIMRCTCGTSAESWYRLLANLVDGVPIRRGALVFPVPAPVAAGTHQPAVITAPAVTGQAKVGATLTATPGTYSGNPVPTLTRRWMRGSTAIAGATYTTYQLQLADLGAIVRYEEVATNSAGSAVGASNSVGPIAAAILSIDPPATIDIAQGGTYALAQHVSGGVPPYGEYAVDTGSLPANVSLNPSTGVLSASAAASVGTTTGLKFKVDDAYVAPSLPLFKVLSAAGGTDLPFTFGHVFGKGEVPAGSFLNSDLADWQANPTTYWPDGSLRHAIISGRATCTAGVQKNVALSVAGADRTGAALTEANLASALPAVTLECGAGGESISLNALVGTAARHRTVCAGPVMANFIYRKQLSGSQHLVSWFDVRLYKGGAVEIFPWVENCYLLAANPTNDVRTWTLSIGGSVKFSKSIDIKHHTRIPLIDNTASTFKHWSYWTTADPQITPQHDGAHMRATRMVDNIVVTPVDASFGVATQVYAPCQIGNYDWGAQAGSSGSLIEHWSALYVVSGDARAYRSTIANGLSAGSFSIHYRDGATNDPIKFSSFPNASLQGGTPPIPDGVGGTNGSYNITHAAALAYMPWLLTGRWFFLDELLFVNSWNYLQGDATRRFGAEGFVNPRQGALTERGAAWAMRDLSETLVSLPADHPCYADIYAQWAACMDRAKRYFVDGDLYTDQYMSNKDWSNSLGQIPPYGGYQSDIPGSTGWWSSPWMNNYYVAAVGRAWNMDLPQASGTKSKHQALRDWLYRYPVGLAGDASGFGYRHFGNYTIPVAASVVDGLASGFRSSWADVYTEWLALRPNAATDMSPGLTLKYGGLGANDVVATDFDSGIGSGTFLGAAIVALALAKEHGAAGADAAWARITGSPSWALRDGVYNMWPRRGVMPR